MGLRLLLTFGALTAVALQAVPTALLPAADGPKNEPARVLGVSSCAARNCHGGDEPLPSSIVRSEYTTWESLDPHTRSYSTLLSAESDRIARLWSRNKDAKAVTEPRCLACHAERVVENGKTSFHSVGCESCHGPASNWLDPHTFGKNWREKFPQAAADLLDVNDLTASAKNCAGCHIGSPTSDIPGVPRDMNHDMIAAGHPPLHFEFAGYLAQLPEHWNAKKHTGDRDYFAKAWSAGQIASAQAALDLLDYRTQQSTWPELAEYACYMCHHNIRGSGDWRQSRRESPGTPAWGAWHFAALPAIVTDADALKKIDEFRRLMAARPDGKSAREAAGNLKPILSAIARQPVSPADRQAVLAALRKAAPNDWAGAAQLYLALAALGTEADRQALRKAWEELRRPSEFQGAIGERLHTLGQQGKSP